MIYSADGLRELLRIVATYAGSDAGNAAKNQILASFEHWKQEAELERAALRVGALDVAALGGRAEKAEAKLVALAKAVRTEQLAHRAKVEASCIHAFEGDDVPDCADCKRETQSYADHKAAWYALDALVAKALGEVSDV